MVFNTLTVGAAVTPSVIETYFSHYLHRAPLRQKPTAHISYHEGLRLIHEFLDYSAKHTVEDLQSFTSQWVPSPAWVRINDAEIAPKFLDHAAKLLQAQLGRRGLDMIGGRTWWQWRRPESPLRAEWIEMKKEHYERKRTGAKCERVILYVHGGAYYFGSVDEHRYQMQRHARKLKARVLAPRYRLAPQFPFPCGLYDCLATYYYLLEHFDPSQIIFAGDSAGGGMVLSMLVTLRDQEQPLPAGTILLSPWVDLTHSFPSVAGDGVGDYIPSHGFHHKPSMAWPPPPNSGTKPSGAYGVPTDAVELPASGGTDLTQRQNDREEMSALPGNRDPESHIVPFGEKIKMKLDGETVELDEQIQIYTTNSLLAHPLVSPVLQPSLGGLPPMLIQTGGAELLRDEQIYIAHKAANPRAYPSNETIMREFDPQGKALERWPPTDVQIQLWEDLCHVPHTLSFTRPAKHMYRSVAQFAAWALKQAQDSNSEAQGNDDDDATSIISSEGEEDDTDMAFAEKEKEKMISVGKAGDPLPAFKDHMIRQRVSRHGVIYPLAPVAEIDALKLDPATIGVPKSGPVRKWLATRAASDQRFASERKKIARKREKEVAAGYDEVPGEDPPPTALVNRRRHGVAPEEKKKGRSWGLAMWSGWGSSHDEHTLQRVLRTQKEKVRSASVGDALDTSQSNGYLSTPASVSKRRRRSSVSAVSSRLHMPWLSRGSDRSPVVSRSGPGAPHVDEPVEAGQGRSPDLSRSRSTPALVNPQSDLLTRPTSKGTAANSPIPVEHELSESYQDLRNAAQAPIPTMSTITPSSEKIVGSENTYLSPTSSRPHNGMQAYPFKLRDVSAANPSTATLDSQIPPPTLQVSGAGDSTPHSELVGDAPKPVELPSAAPGNESEEDLPGRSVNGAESSGAAAQASEDRLLATSTPNEPGTRSGSVSDAAWADAEEQPYHSVRTSGEDGAETLVSPIEPPAQQRFPFKVRNPVFDHRTSMLGSIGADGMPNAHYAFLRDDSPKRPTSSSENTPPSSENGKPDENVKPAPFKLRHTVYDPESTLTKKPSEPQLPDRQASQRTADENQIPPSTRESGALGGQVDQRIVGDAQQDEPPSYSGPVTNIIMPETIPKRSVVKQPSMTEDASPPPPPPKDEKHLPANSGSGRKATGVRKPNPGSISSASGVQVNGNARATTNDGGGAPKLGALSFEQDPRSPQLESFVSASAAKDV